MIALRMVQYFTLLPLHLLMGLVCWLLSPILPPAALLTHVGDDGMPTCVSNAAGGLTYAKELTAITAPYRTDRDTLCAAWLRAAVADGTEETVRKEDVESEIAELDAQYDADVAALKTKYGVS